jgi:hypothetical protein
MCLGECGRLRGMSCVADVCMRMIFKLQNPGPRRTVGVACACVCACVELGVSVVVPYRYRSPSLPHWRGGEWRSPRKFVYGSDQKLGRGVHALFQNV